MKLFLFILIAYGMSNIIVFSSIFKGWRTLWSTLSPNFFGTLFNCMICWPYWQGVLGSVIVWSPTLYYGLIVEPVTFFGLFEIPNVLTAAFLDGCLTSACVWLIHSFQEATERHFNVNNHKDDDTEVVTVDFPE